MSREYWERQRQAEEDQILRLVDVALSDMEFYDHLLKYAPPGRPDHIWQLWERRWQDAFMSANALNSQAYDCRVRRYEDERDDWEEQIHREEES